MGILKSIALAMIGTLLLMTVAHAQSGITIQWFYGSNTYSTQAAAVAAMQAAKPQNSVLTVPKPGTSMANGRTQYMYVAPSPLQPSQQTVYWGGSGSPLFYNANDAVNWEIETYFSSYEQGCGGGASGSPDGAPVYSSNLGSPSFGPGYVQNYDLNWWSFDIYPQPQGTCTAVTTKNQLVVTDWLAKGCPTYYSLLNGQCVDNDFDYIYSTQLICQKPSTSVGDP